VLAEAMTGRASPAAGARRLGYLPPGTEVGDSTRRPRLSAGCRASTCDASPSRLNMREESSRSVTAAPNQLFASRVELATSPLHRDVVGSAMMSLRLPASRIATRAPWLRLRLRPLGEGPPSTREHLGLAMSR